MGTDTKMGRCHSALQQLLEDGHETVESPEVRNAVILALTTIRGSEGSELSTDYTISEEEPDFTPHCSIEPEYRQIWCDFKLFDEDICHAPATHMTWWKQIELHYCNYHYGIYCASQGLEAFRPVEVGR